MKRISFYWNPTIIINNDNDNDNGEGIKKIVVFIVHIKFFKCFEDFVTNDVASLGAGCVGYTQYKRYTYSMNSRVDCSI